MQFKSPEILYFLFVLIIPILLHLFRLQRFEKVAFTNVKLLKKMEQQTRKSSQLKKFLILLSRLLLFACLILAFAQPSLHKKSSYLKEETFVYLDNSFSMQAKAEGGELLQKAKNDLIKNLSNKTGVTTLITNDRVIKNLNNDDLKKEIIEIDYYPIKKDLKTILLQIHQLKNKNSKTSNKVLLISDFQTANLDVSAMELDSTFAYAFIQTLPNNRENVAIDSVWTSNENKENLQINASVKSYDLPVENLSVSLYLDNKIFGKTTVTIEKNERSVVEFMLPNTKNMQGRLHLNDNKLAFDNTLYFSLTDKEKIPVLAIGDNTDFLSKIYTEDEFDFRTTALRSLDYSSIPNQKVILLNELQSLPNALINNLLIFTENEGHIVIIPSLQSELSSYNKLFSALNKGEIIAKNHTQKAVTGINYSHPFFKNVFQKQITNFQYPIVKSFFEANIPSASTLLQFEDKRDFISVINFKNGKIYWLAAALGSNNSNFKNSPLIVPVFYNFSLQNNNREKLFYSIGSQNEIIVPSNSETENVWHIVKNEIDFIPLQSKTANHVKIQTSDKPLEHGIYQLKNENRTIRNLAYNYHREESSLVVHPIENHIKKYKNAQYYSSLNNALKNINEQNKNQNLWQLFIIFALLFLGLEILFHKILKS